MTTLSSHTATLPHSPAEVYALWSDPNSWPDWDPDVAEVTFPGPIAPDARGRMRPTTGPATTFTLTVCEPDRRLTTQSRLPGATLTFDHVVSAAAEGSLVEVRINVDGALAPLWSRVLRSAFTETAVRNVTGLAAHLDLAHR